jgi:hypothetical protein
MKRDSDRGASHRLGGRPLFHLVWGPQGCFGGHKSGHCTHNELGVAGIWTNAPRSRGSLGNNRSGGEN